MVIDIDAVRYGAGFDAAGHWHEAKADFVPSPEQKAEREWMAPARGAILGLLLSGAMWVGVIAALRAVIAIIR